MFPSAQPVAALPEQNLVSFWDNLLRQINYEDFSSLQVGKHYVVIENTI